MATTVEINAEDFFRLIEVKPSTKLYDVCYRHFSSTAYYRHKNSSVHLTTLQIKSFQTLSPLTDE